MKIKNIEFEDKEITKETVVLFDVELDNGKVRNCETLISEYFAPDTDDETIIRVRKIYWIGWGSIPDRANVEKTIKKKIVDKYEKEKRSTGLRPLLYCNPNKSNIKY